MLIPLAIAFALLLAPSNVWAAPAPQAGGGAQASGSGRGFTPNPPPTAPNPPIPGTTPFGISVGGFVCDWLCLGGQAVVDTKNGTTGVLLLGGGWGWAVSANAGSNVTAPTSPGYVIGGSLTGLGPVKGSVNVSGPLSSNYGDPNAVKGSANIGLALPGIPESGNVRGSVSCGASGCTTGGQVSLTSSVANALGIDTGTWLAGFVRIPIPLGTGVDVGQPDKNGVYQVTIQNGDAGPVTFNMRDVSGLGYPIGVNGYSAQTNPDGSWTLHTPTSDITTYGPDYMQQQGLENVGRMGTLTQNLLDPSGQSTTQWTWQDANGGATITKDADGTLTQVNPEGSAIKEIIQTSSGAITQVDSNGATVSYNPANGVISTSTPGQLFGLTLPSWLGGTQTTYYSNGDVIQRVPGLSTTWDSTGSTSYATGAFSTGFSGTDPKPPTPAIPAPIYLPHDPSNGVPVAASPPDPTSQNGALGDAGTTGQSSCSADFCGTIIKSTTTGEVGGSSTAETGGGPAASGSAGPTAPSSGAVTAPTPPANSSAPVPPAGYSAPAKSPAKSPPDDESASDPPADSSASVPPADSSAQSPPADVSASVPSADSSAQSPPADVSASAPPADSSDSAPTADTSAPVPPSDASAPVPPVDTSAPAPPPGGSASAPPADSSAPVQPADTSAPVPPASSSASVPPADTSAPVPPAATSAPVPPADTSAPVPPADSSAPAPPADSSAPVPPADTSAPAPPADSSAQVPPADSPAPAPPDDSSAPPADTSAPASPDGSVDSGSTPEDGGSFAVGGGGGGGGWDDAPSMEDDLL